jgi:8-oxo-dGTP pyrophosphatase MutT (NUDIX family)
MAIDIEALQQQLVDPHNDGLWMREQLMPRFVDGDAARPNEPPPGAPPPRLGAVLVLLYAAANDVYLPLTVRTAALRNHSGEVSLPGGSYDAADGDLQQTALREAWEELAIPAKAVTLWTQLTPVWIPVSNFQITPFVGWAQMRPNFALAVSEVAALLDVPLSLLLQPDVVQREERTIRGTHMHIPYFAIGDYKVWGATAIVLAELVGKLRQSRS